MSIYAVIGNGPNELQIPLVMFPSKEEADAFVSQFPESEKYQGWLSCDFTDSSGEYDPQLAEVPGEIHSLYFKLFKDGHYYPGCGGCYSLEVCEVKFGEPMVGWDLD